VTFKVIHLLQAFSNAIFRMYSCVAVEANQFEASRGPSAIADRSSCSNSRGAFTLSQCTLSDARWKRTASVHSSVWEMP